MRPTKPAVPNLSRSPGKGRYLAFAGFTMVGIVIWTAVVNLRPDPPASAPLWIVPAWLGGLYVLAAVAGLFATEKRSAVYAFAGYVAGVVLAEAYGLTDMTHDSAAPFLVVVVLGVPMMPAFLTGYALIRWIGKR